MIKVYDFLDNTKEEKLRRLEIREIADECPLLLFGVPGILRRRCRG